MKKLTSLLFTFSLLLFTSAANAAAELPSGYVEVGYIESTTGGGQYINTDYKPTANTRIVADFDSMTRSQNWAVFFGVTGNDSASDGVLLRYTNASDAPISAWFCGASDAITGFAGKRLTAELKSGSIKLGETISTFTTSGTPYNGPIYIFCGNNGGKAWRHQAMRLYSLQIYEGNTPKRDFVPCIRTSDGVAGLYDLVGRNFYGNAGSGVFGCGLKSGRYEFNQSFQRSAPTGESALKVANGADVMLIVPSGVTVTLRGGDANGTIGAGAGIEVPASATLRLGGAGTLNAYGGKAANGANGENGKEGSLWYNYDEDKDDDWITTAAGGAGGGGGGGGGAGGASYDKDSDDIIRFKKNGKGGEGGVGPSSRAEKGKSRADMTNPVTWDDETEYVESLDNSDTSEEMKGGKGGTGGGKGSQGSSGTVETLPTVDYIDENGKSQTLTDLYRIVTAETSVFGGDCWYVVAGEVTRTGGIDVSANCTANLILCDGASLVVTGVGKDCAGIDVCPGETLNIYGEKNGTGLLRVQGGYDGAGIGGKFKSAGGIVTINGGTVVATGGYDGAGIGGGDFLGDGGIVTINGGTVVATGGYNGAGIGGGDTGKGGLVKITGGTVTATGSNHGAGIGGGGGGAGGSVTITGGTVTATGSNDGAGIGGGERGAGGSVTITGGTVTATGSNGGAGIGGGNERGGGSVTISGGAVKAVGRTVLGEEVSITGGIFGMEVRSDWCGAYLAPTDNLDPATRNDYPWTVQSAVRVTVGAHMGMSVFWTSGDGSETNAVGQGTSFLIPLNKAERVKVMFIPNAGLGLVGDTEVYLGTVEKDVVFGDESGLQIPTLGPVSYLDGDADLKERSGAEYEVVDADIRTLANGKWYVAGGTIVIDSPLMVNGTANIILCDGATLTVNGGIRVEGSNAINIYAQSEGTGTVIANGANGCAGIGGGKGAWAPITVFLEERGKGGPGGTCGTVTVYGGVVRATGGSGGAGVGGGAGGDTDGNNGRFADHRAYCYIGDGGKGGAGGTVIVRGGCVIAEGSNAAGIGGGAGGNPGLNLDIDGWAFPADKQGRGGDGGTGGRIVISGGRVEATGATGIGGGPGVSGLRGDGVRGDEGTVELDESKVCFTIEGTIGNGGSSVTIAEVLPTCKDGEIAEVEEGVWTVTPSNDVTEVTITGLPKSATLVVPPTVTKVTGVNDGQIRVWDGDTDVTAQYFIHGGVISPFETFDDRRHYVESTASDGQYIDTGYKPTINTRIVADFNSMTRRANWSVFFGVTSGDTAENGILLRYFEAEDRFNAWFCNLTNREVRTAPFASQRIAAELQSGSLTINGTNTYSITTKGTPYDGSIYIFCGNNGGSAWRPQAMRLYSFQIYEGDTLKRDFVPCRATDGTEAAGLYDRVTKKCFANAGGGSLTLGEDEGPTCTGGVIVPGEDGEWVVTPDTDATEVEIAGLPTGAIVVVPPTVTKVTGADDGKIRIRARVADGEDAVVTHDITGAFTITGGAIALNPEGEVKIGEKEIPVKPMIGGSDGEDAVVTQPFVVGEGAVSVKVATIPGLKYTLKRTDSLRRAEDVAPYQEWDAVGESVVATGPTVTLTDGEPPADKAFYVIVVSAP